MATAIGIAGSPLVVVLPRIPGLREGPRAGGRDPRAWMTRTGSRSRPRPPGPRPAPLPGSVARAYQFLDQMMDLRTSGPAPRLVQSYTGGLLGQQGDTSASIYDNALLIDAYLAEGTAGGVARAKTIGRALVYLQAHDPRPRRAAAQRVRAGPAGRRERHPGHGPGQQHRHPGLGRAGSRPALRGHPDPGLPAGRDHAGRLDPVAVPGRARGGRVRGRRHRGRGEDQWKSTEHNIDVFAFFRLLARETGDPAWSQRAGLGPAVRRVDVEPGARAAFTSAPRLTASPGTTPRRSRT